VTIAVIIDEPKIGGRDGGQVAAPVFKEIAEQILPELNIRPDVPTETIVADNDAEEFSEEPLGETFGSPLISEPIEPVADAPAVPKAESRTSTSVALPKKDAVSKPAEQKVEKKESPAPPKRSKETETVVDRPRVVVKEKPGTEVKRKT
jgi:hypothetical protein